MLVAEKDVEEGMSDGLAIGSWLDFLFVGGDGRLELEFCGVLTNVTFGT